MNSLTYGTVGPHNKGSHWIEVRANLQNYTSINDDSVHFNVTFYELETIMEMEDLKYTLEEDEIVVQVPEPVFVPHLHLINDTNVKYFGYGDDVLIKYSV